MHCRVEAHFIIQGAFVFRVYRCKRQENRLKSSVHPSLDSLDKNDKEKGLWETSTAGSCAKVQDASKKKHVG